MVTQKEALQSAADEARKAARAAREFAGILDEYAKFIVQPNSRQKADDVHQSAMNKLRVVNDGLAVCVKWGEEARTSPVGETPKAANREAGDKRGQAAKTPLTSYRPNNRRTSR
jgi:hypothetical protein